MEMEGDDWLSVRMRASRNGTHVSGAERLVPRSFGSTVTLALMRRAGGHPQGVPDRIVLTIDLVHADEIRSVPVLRPKTIRVADEEEGRRRAAQCLVELGVTATVVDRAMRLLGEGPSPDGANMRGAIVMDAATGRRCEPDPYRGVRVSVVDMEPTSRARFDRFFRDRFPAARFRDALILASKVASVEGMVAELCWSDDPAYLPGYVASRAAGYVRFTHLKRAGSPYGGRVYFIDGRCFDLEKQLAYLESTPVLVRIPADAAFEEA